MSKKNLSLTNFMKINQNNLNLFWAYISKRHNIYKDKNLLGKPFPWTEDKILKEFKFTNVFRDLDPWTIFVINNIVPNSSNLENLIFNIIIYRLYNKIGTFAHVWIQDTRNYNRGIFENKLREHVLLWNKVFTNAFIVSWYSFLSEEWDKISRTTKIIYDISKKLPDIAIELENNKNSKFTFEKLISLPWIGHFLTYQICVDLWYGRNDLFNEGSFVIAWPWCKRWLDRIFDSRWSKAYEDLIFWLEKNQHEGFKKLWIDMNILFEDRKEKCLNIMAIENCLCEFSKYMKAYSSEWRPRNRYR